MITGTVEIGENMSIVELVLFVTLLDTASAESIEQLIKQCYLRKN
jgi:hypothetical protein